MSKTKESEIKILFTTKLELIFLAKLVCLCLDGEKNKEIKEFQRMASMDYEISKDDIDHYFYLFSGLIEIPNSMIDELFDVMIRERPNRIDEAELLRLAFDNIIKFRDTISKPDKLHIAVRGDELVIALKK